MSHSFPTRRSSDRDAVDEIVQRWLIGRGVERIIGGEHRHTCFARRAGETGEAAGVVAPIKRRGTKPDMVWRLGRELDENGRQKPLFPRGSGDPVNEA